MAGILNENHQSRLKSTAMRIEVQSNIAVKVVTTFHFNEDWDVQLYYLAGGTATHDSRLVVLVKTNRSWWDDQLSFDQDFEQHLSLGRSENLNTEERLPDWFLAGVKEAIVTKYNQYAGTQDVQLASYQALNAGLDLLRQSLHTPVEDGIYSGLISKTLWLNLSDTPGTREAQYDYTPQVAGSVNSLYRMAEETVALVEQVPSAARATLHFLFYYQTDISYRTAVDYMIEQALHTLSDPQVQQQL
jgi:hypothetical protein